MTNAETTASAFIMGLQIAEHYHGFIGTHEAASPKEIVEIVAEISKGAFTLIGSPDDLRASTGRPSQQLPKGFADRMNQVRDIQRELAGELLPELTKVLRPYG